MKTYFKEIQKVSDDLCRGYGLSVIQPKGKGKSHVEWQAEKTKKPTIRAQIRWDIDGIIGRSLNFTTFLKDLRSAGYEVRYDRRKYTAVKPPYGKKFIRLDSLGENYTDSAIERRILAQQTWSRPKRPDAPRRYFCKGTLRRSPKYHGFAALYFRYVYLLRGAAKGRTSPKVSRYLLEDTIRFEVYMTQHNFLAKYQIATAEQLPSNIRLPLSLIPLCGNENYFMKKEGTPMNQKRKHCRRTSARAPPRSKHYGAICGCARRLKRMSHGCSPVCRPYK